MKHKKLQFLVPQYKETEETVSFLLGSIECQVEIDKNDIGVIICSDGGGYVLNHDFLNKYSFDIDYVICKHRGVSATRNSAFLLSDADYVMFCDADDGFCNTFGIKIIFENIKMSESNGEPFDVLSSKFFSERQGENWGLNIMDHNSVYVHGRVFRREFLLNNFIFFDERVTANEDCFFNISTNMISKSTKNLNVPIYCWRQNPESVTHDPKYMLKTLDQLIHSNDDVIELMILLKKDEKSVANTTFDLICKTYLDYNKTEWHLPENTEYKHRLITTLKEYIIKRGTLCSCLTHDDKKEILQKTRGTSHYGQIESITFDDFIKLVMTYGEEKK